MTALWLTLALIGSAGLFWKGIIMPWADLACAGFLGMTLTMVFTLLHLGYIT